MWSESPWLRDRQSCHSWFCSRWHSYHEAGPLMAQCLKFLSPCDSSNYACAEEGTSSMAAPFPGEAWCQQGLGGWAGAQQAAWGRAVHECKKLCARTVLHCGFYFCFIIILKACPNPAYLQMGGIIKTPASENQSPVTKPATPVKKHGRSVGALTPGYSSLASF